MYLGFLYKLNLCVIIRFIQYNKRAILNFSLKFSLYQILSITLASCMGKENCGNWRHSLGAFAARLSWKWLNKDVFDEYFQKPRFLALDWRLN